MKYLALGDSYTIGESVDQKLTFPFQLIDGLKTTGIPIDEIKVLAKTGWTTGDLLKGIQSAKPKPDYDLVTLLTGVNNQYRGYAIEEYNAELQILINQSIKLAKGNPKHVIVISIPDYGVTPFGMEMAKKIDSDLRLFNQINKELAHKNGLHWVDVFEISKLASIKTELICNDKLHPSAEMYSLWVDAILPVSKSILEAEK